MSDAPASLAHYAQERQLLVESARPGPAAAEELARLTDEAVAALTAAASRHVSGQIAVLALGGYGARRLLPASDIDLFVVHEDRGGDLEAFTRELFYPFWDLGLQVGHQVRTRKEHLRASREDVTILAATLTGRVVAGDPRLGERALDDVLSWAHRRRAQLARTLAERDRPGSPYLLEPDLKEGAGGQRDLDELVWRAALQAGQPTTVPNALVDAGTIDHAALDLLSRAQETLTEARWRLGLKGSRTPNVMTVEDAVYRDVDATGVQEALADVDALLDTVRHPAAYTDPQPWSAERLLEALRSGLQSLPALERAARAGRLDALVPGMRERMVLRRPALSHRYTVGAHSLRAATLVGEPDPDDALGSRICSGLPDDTPLLVATLLHDAGKDEPGSGHAERGAAVAEHASRGFGLDRPLAWGVSTLVREHLLLSETAAGHDLSDEDVVLTAAARVGDRSLVGPLYLLTKADMRATGPSVWTPWRAALIGELATKMDAALADEIDGAGIVESAREVRTAALRRATGAGMERAVLAFVEEAPLRYLADRDTDEVLRHARLVRELRGPLGHAGLVVDVSPGVAPQSWRVTVVARDREGLFATIAGVLALCDLDILGAEAFTEARGVVLDVFTVASASLAAIEDERWALFERTLRQALAGHLDLETRLADRRLHHRPRSTMEPHVQLDTTRPVTTVVRVTATDRVGLLHDVADAIHAAGLDIRFAAVGSSEGVATDAFHVVDAQGEPVRDPSLLSAIGAAVEEAARA